MNEPRITQTHSAFSIVCRVEFNIQASAERIWNLLTDAAGFPLWNSTVTRIEGQIREGERLKLHVPGSNRVFTPKVSGVVPNQRMIWTGGFAPVFKGVRTFDLKGHIGGSTDFAMAESFSGLFIPMIKRSLPDFGPIFETYSRDLKRAAERDAVTHR